jgi:tRNA threonylcarbamoyl adenosine modification protein (Sua5/YciO/YrdC/YwlC family)
MRRKRSSILMGMAMALGTGVYRTPAITAYRGRDVVICSVVVARGDMLRFAPSIPVTEKEAWVHPEIVKISSQEPEASLVSYVAEKIRAGEVLGMPTDTFYGLAADPFNLHAVDRVYEIKSRSRHKPLSLLIESVDQAAELAWPVPEIFYLLARRFWPGPLTIIVKADPKLPLKVTANTGNVALRVPAAEIPLAIIRAGGMPITATSANLSGESECTSALQVRDQLGDCLSIIVDGGQSPRDMPSTIIDLTSDDGSWRVMRHGAIPEEQILELLGGQE